MKSQIYINYDDDFTIDLTPDEILEDQRLENQYFNQDNQDQNESNTTTDTPNHLENSGNMFFDLSLYNLENPQNNQAPKTIPEKTTSISKKRPLLDDDSVLIKPPLKKKVSSAWLNLDINSNSDKNISKDSQTYFTDNGHIDPKFRRTHVPYLTKKILMAQKAEKEREKMIMEEENERISNNISPYSGDMDVFYKEVIRRPLDGIHVDVEEKFEIDW